jgi:hypothetical protein
MLVLEGGNFGGGIGRNCLQNTSPRSFSTFAEWWMMVHGICRRWPLGWQRRLSQKLEDSTAMAVIGQGRCACVHRSHQEGQWIQYAK